MAPYWYDREKFSRCKEQCVDATLKLADPIVPQMIQFLRQAIIEMQLRPGQALSENDIARQYGVSRQPVREAFIKLREVGLLQILPSRGTYVVKVSVREVLNARFVREAVECAIVKSAAELIDDAGSARLSALIADQKHAAAAGDYRRFYGLDEAFHREIANIIECDYAVRVVESARAQIDRVRFLSLPGATPLDILIEQHQAIADALGAGKAQEAEAAMRLHLREILSALPSLARLHPDIFDETTIPAHAERIGSTP
jgi:GntR family transcriptional regulator, rspAB operon transcriptional repressor